MCFRKREKATNGYKEIMSTFTIPTGNNSITKTDIGKGQVRITRDNKKYFPDYDCDIKIIVNDNSFFVKYRLGNNKDKVRSHLIILGHDIIDLLELSSEDHLDVQRVDEMTYIISKG